MTRPDPLAAISPNKQIAAMRPIAYPIKIERANINVINSATAPTTRVPKVIGLTEQQAIAAIVAARLTASRQIDLRSPPDTVTAQNAPAGTVEPIGSPVQITVGIRSNR